MNEENGTERRVEEVETVKQEVRKISEDNLKKKL